MLRGFNLARFARLFVIFFYENEKYESFKNQYHNIYYYLKIIWNIKIVQKMFQRKYTYLFIVYIQNLSKIYKYLKYKIFHFLKIIWNIKIIQKKVLSRENEKQCVDITSGKYLAPVIIFCYNTIIVPSFVRILWYIWIFLNLFYHEYKYIILTFSKEIYLFFHCLYYKKSI